jgi:hypothetical protein
MQNLFLVPTDKPTRLHLDSELFITPKTQLSKEINSIVEGRNIYITSDEEIKEGDWVVENHTFKRKPYVGKCFYPKNDGTVTDEVIKRDLLSVNYEGHYKTLARKHNCKKIILTTDPDLIADGVQAIDNEFLEWFVKNPTVEYVTVERLEDGKYVDYLVDGSAVEGVYENYKIIIPQEESKCTCEEHDPYCCEVHGICPTCVKKEEPKQETIEEVAKKYSELQAGTFTPPHKTTYEQGFEDGAKWKSERMYSEEDLREAFRQGRDGVNYDEDYGYSSDDSEEEWFEQFKKK